MRSLADYDDQNVQIHENDFATRLPGKYGYRRRHFFVSKNISVAAATSEDEGVRPASATLASNDPDAVSQLLEDPKFHVLAEVRYRFKEHLIVEIENAIYAAEAIIAETEKQLN